MAHILDISKAVPEFSIEKEEMVKFYANASDSPDDSLLKKLNFLSKKTKINTRYSCIPDFKGRRFELFTNGNYKQPIEKRMELYKEKIMPLSIAAIDKVLKQTEVESSDITHLITVSCTGLFAPGLEFLIAEHYGIEHVEKIGLNFLGCYAALKALKHAHYITQTDPTACVLILSAELCSLHFFPSDVNEDIVSNLLFSDGAAAVIVCGDKSLHTENKIVLNIDDIGTAFIPNTSNLMSWNITSSAFRMHLSQQVVEAIGSNIKPLINDFLKETRPETDYWAIHPGGVKIVEAVQENLELAEQHVEDSKKILEQYGNMSSPTILFILESIFQKIKNAKDHETKKIFSCAFGPGLNIEMIRFSSLDNTLKNTNHSIEGSAIRS